MNIDDILFTALFCFSMVFALLGGLYTLMKVFTDIVRFIEIKTKTKN